MLLYGKSWFLMVLLLCPISFDMEQVETVPKKKLYENQPNRVV